MPEVECGSPGAPRQLIDFGPTLAVRIGFDPNYPNYGPGGGINLSKTLYPALIDTGASGSCIDSTVAKTLGLPVVDRIVISGVHGSDHVNVHLAQIEAPSFGFVLYRRFAGVHLRAGGQAHAALLGRDFLGRGFTMIYDGAAASVKLRR